MSNRSAAPLPATQARFIPAESPAAIAPRGRDVIPAAGRAGGQAGRLELPAAELSFIHLRTHQEIERIIPLREEIQLPAAVLADPGFAAREKKGMRRGSSPHSDGAGPTSGRSA